jgi:hypothetical protein
LAADIYVAFTVQTNIKPNKPAVAGMSSTIGIKSSTAAKINERTI